MTVSTTDSVIEYVSGGPAFPIPYRFLKDSDIQAVLVKQDGTSETLVLGSQYTLVGAGTQSGGTLTSAYAAGYLATPGAILTISRVMDAVQPTDLRNQGRFLAETHETVFDRLTMLIQQGFSILRRALLRPIGKNYYDAEGRQIKNLGDGAADLDAVNVRTMRNYVDAAVAGVVGGFGWFIHNFADAVYRTFQDKMRDQVTVKDFGGNTDGLTDNSAAILAMASELGYVVFGLGGHACNTCTIDAHVIFEPGGYLIANAGQTITIRGGIEAPKQFIFRGPGLYALQQNDSGVGEDSRHVHASWFGAFPSVINSGDQAPFIHNAFASMGNARESVIDFDVGGYVISSQVTITRGGWVKGDGSRRTVFKFNGDGYIGFIDTVSGLAKITDCNFELIPGTVSNRVSPFVQFNGNESEFYNVRLGETEKGIVVTGNSTRIYNIAAAYGNNKPVGSDLVHIKGGNGHFVENIQLATSAAFGPEALVRVGGAGGGGINDVNINTIYHMTPSVSVIVEAANDNISGVFIDSVQYNGFSGTPPAQLVKLATSGAASMENVKIDGVQGSSRSVAMVTLQQDSSTSMTRISINNIQDKRVGGNGIELIRTAGVLENIDIGSGVQLKTRDNPVFRSGTIGELRIAAGVEKDTTPRISRFANIADDAVFVVDLRKSVFSTMIEITTNTGSTLNYGLYAARAASTPAVAVINQTATMNTALTALTGTTGTDGRITLGVTNGFLYLENRSGAAINATVEYMAG